MALASDATFHFFGSGKGESILIETSSGWGMIDCFSVEGKVPSLEFLQNQGVDELRFLALTHPHDDHFGGLPEVADWFTSKQGIRQFWRYPTLDVKHLLPLLRSRAAQLGTPFAQRQLDAMSSLQLFYERLGKEIRAGRTELMITGLGQSLLSSQTFGVDLAVVAPAGKMVAEAEDTLARTIEAQSAGRPLPDWDLNRLSSAFHVRFSGGELLLGGDVPLGSWKSSMVSDLFPAMSVNVFKVSHHGSKKDNPKALLDQVVSTTGADLAVITRYSPSRLPRPESVLELEQRFAEVTIIGRPNQPLTTGPVQKRRSYETQRLEVQVSSSGVTVHQPVAC